MNRIITTIICMLVSLVAPNGAAAEQPAVRLVLPFNFNASGIHLSAGPYTLATENGSTLITKKITKKSTGESTFVRAIPVIHNLLDESKLVCSTYGDQRFFRKILCPRLNMTLELLPSKPEIAAQAQTSTNQGS